MGARYNGRRFREALDRLQALYGDQGYVNARIDGTFERDPASQTVILALSITENEVVYVGRVQVQKPEFEYEFDLNALERFVDWTSPGVREETVQREVRLKPGEKYRTVDEVRTKQRLRNLGFFRRVEVQRVPTSDPQVNDVIVAVEEDPAAGYIGLSAGVGERSGPSVGINYTNPNLFGEARVLKAQALVGSRTSYFNIGYLDRHFKDTDNSLDLNLYRDQDRYRGYGQRTYGASAEYGTPFSEHVKGFARVRLENVNLKRRSDDLEESMDTYNVFAVRGLVAKDMRNDLKWTTKGYLLNGGLEVGYADGFLLKATHALDWYKSLSKDEDWVYAYGHRVGLMPYDADQVGISERFFLGGTSSLRGFAPRGAGPKDGGDRRVVVGGSTLLTQRHELRHRFTDYLAGRVFVDAGILEESFLELGRPRVGTGAGVTFDLGAVALDLDLAAAVVRESRDRTRVLHFRLRSNF
jgi:outer membrane protein insertion porin family